MNILSAQYGGDKLLQVTSMLVIINTERINFVAEQCADLGSRLPHQFREAAYQLATLVEGGGYKGGRK